MNPENQILLTQIAGIIVTFCAFVTGRYIFPAKEKTRIPDYKNPPPPKKEVSYKDLAERALEACKDSRNGKEFLFFYEEYVNFIKAAKEEEKRKAQIEEEAIRRGHVGKVIGSDKLFLGKNPEGDYVIGPLEDFLKERKASLEEEIDRKLAEAKQELKIALARQTLKECGDLFKDSQGKAREARVSDIIEASKAGQHYREYQEAGRINYEFDYKNPEAPDK